MNDESDKSKEEMRRKLEALFKATKSLQYQQTHKDELDDRRILGHVKKAVNKLDQETDDRIEKVLQHVNTLQEPIHAKFLILSKEAEGLARQNIRFIALYRECLQELSKEIKEKKQVLDTS